jgi:glycosyltransferase involved in cell wall biosynthesis
VLSVIIPTLNEAETLEDVIQRCRPFADELLVIDGHSTDGTQDIARRLGVRCEADTGHGKGGALRRAAELAKGDILVFIDADGSHVPEDIPSLVAPILKGEADHVTASRLIGGSSELHGGFDEFLRLTGSSFITACINWHFRVCLSDSQNGFRAIRKDIFLNLGLTSNSTTIEQEMIMRSLALGYRMAEVPSHEYRRKGGVSKVQLTRVWPKYLYSLLYGLIFLRRREKTVAAAAPVGRSLKESV